MLQRFFRSEPAAGIVLFAAAALALVIANSPLEDPYHDLLHRHLGGLTIHAWINDGLMAVFFLLVGLEIKRETIEGKLATWRSRALPGFAALGGMIAPALVFGLINRGNAEHLDGWAIPAATDIAFAIGVLTLLGPRVPPALRVLLVGIAIADDLGAIVIIAVFYTSALAWGWFAAAAAIWLACFALNRRGVSMLLPYIVLGVALWICVYQSGIHATLAGVLLALTIPSYAKGYSPIQVLEIRLDNWVSFLVIPVFGFANAGLSFSGIGQDELFGSLTLGVTLGLVIGKQVGVFGAILLAVRMRLASKPDGVSWMQLYGLALLCGIGFTMSLFIGGLAFETSPHLMDATRLGVLAGSTLTAIAGAVVLRRTLRPVARSRIGQQPPAG
jgi:NhaA family Na+:H+ antiporter